LFAIDLYYRIAKMLQPVCYCWQFKNNTVKCHTVSQRWHWQLEASSKWHNTAVTTVIDVTCTNWTPASVMTW